VARHGVKYALWDGGHFGANFEPLGSPAKLQIGWAASSVEALDLGLSYNPSTGLGGNANGYVAALRLDLMPKGHLPTGIGSVDVDGRVTVLAAGAGIRSEMTIDPVTGRRNFDTTRFLGGAVDVDMLSVRYNSPEFMSQITMPQITYRPPPVQAEPSRWDMVWNWKAWALAKSRGK